MNERSEMNCLTRLVRWAKCIGKPKGKAIFDGVVYDKWEKVETGFYAGCYLLGRTVPHPNDPSRETTDFRLIYSFQTDNILFT